MDFCIKIQIKNIFAYSTSFYFFFKSLFEKKTFLNKMILDLIAKNAEVKEFKNFYFERYDFDVATMEASFFYSFDEEIFFEEKICF